MSVVSVLLVLGGFGLLMGGAWALVEGASRLARMVGISDLVVGLTIVAIGTSSPELAVTLTAAFSGKPDMVIGNIVGSNIANIGLILGLSAILGHIQIPDRLLKQDFLWLLLATLATGVFAIGGRFDRIEGAILLAGAFAFTLFNYRIARGEARIHAGLELPREPGAGRTTVLSIVGVIVGISGLVLGGDLLVRGATDVALKLGVSEYLIGLTMVAVGTSLPELATSVVGVARGQGELILGGIVGSNIYNILLILAAGMLVIPLEIESIILTVQIPLMIGLTLALVPILRDGLHMRTRWGWFLLMAYVAMTAIAVRIDPGA